MYTHKEIMTIDNSINLVSIFTYWQNGKVKPFIVLSKKLAQMDHALINLTNYLNSCGDCRATKRAIQ